MRIAALAAVASMVLLSAGCAPTASPTPSPESIPVTEVIEQLKLELAKFKENTSTAVVGCGGVSGALNFTVSNVAVVLHAELATSGSANIAATIPVNLVTIGPSGQGSLTYDNTEEITLNFTPLATSSPIPTRNTSQLNLANALIDLRDQLTKVAPGGQCLNFATGTGKDPTIRLAFSAVRDVGGGIKFNILALSLGASLDSKSTSQNTITVTLTPPLVPLAHPPRQSPS